MIARKIFKILVRKILFFKFLNMRALTKIKLSAKTRICLHFDKSRKILLFIAVPVKPNIPEYVK